MLVLGLVQIYVHPHGRLRSFESYVVLRTVR